MDDPRDPSLEVKLSVPKTWKEAFDAFGSGTMLVAGIVMMTRNPFLAWPAFLFALSGFINQRPHTTKDGGSATNALLFAASGLFITYMPKLFLPPVNQIKLPTE